MKYSNKKLSIENIKYETRSYERSSIYIDIVQINYKRYTHFANF